MASYKIQWKRSAQKELAILPKETIPKVLHVVEQLEDVRCDALDVSVRRKLAMQAALIRQIETQVTNVS